VTRDEWIDAFTCRGLELDPRMAGTDWDDIAVDLLEEHTPDELDPGAAAERYLSDSQPGP
jgi:hypothetical protein